MTVQPIEIEVTETLWDDHDPTHMIHLVCPECYPDDVLPAVSLCGKVLKGPWVTDNSPTECVVCADLKGCLVCGLSFSS